MFLWQCFCFWCVGQFTEDRVGCLFNTLEGSAVLCEVGEVPERVSPPKKGSLTLTSPGQELWLGPLQIHKLPHFGFCRHSPSIFRFLVFLFKVQTRRLATDQLQTSVFCKTRNFLFMCYVYIMCNCIMWLTDRRRRNISTKRFIVAQETVI